MAETRVVPSGKVYRQIFDAQVHLSLSLHETRLGRAAAHGRYLSGPDDGTRRGRRNMATLDTSPTLDEEQVYDEIRALPDTAVSEKAGSNIIERIALKNQQDHIEALAHLDRDLVALSVGFESLFKQTGEDLLLKLSEHEHEVERLLQKKENDAELETLSLQDMHSIWNTVSNECAMRRKWIQEMDETFNDYETKRTSVISALLKKHTAKLEKVRFLTPCDVYRLINKEAMMINHALLANRQALARLYLHLMEKELQREFHCRRRWEINLQEWKQVKVDAMVRQFKDSMNNSEIQNPRAVQNTLNALYTKQKELNGQRIKILQQIRKIVPPTCSKALIAEWFLSLSSINDKMDRLHVNTIKELHNNYEVTWQAEKKRLENELFAYGLATDQIQKIITTEFLPLIGMWQTKAEVYIATLGNTFQKVANIAANLSMYFLRFANGASHLWEMHMTGLQNRERQLHHILQKVHSRYEEENQAKEAQLDVMVDQLRQKSTNHGLKTALQRALAFLERLKTGYVNLYEEQVSIVERYPSMVLQELNAYSSAVCQFFNVKEVYGQDPKELYVLYPSLKLTGGQRASKKWKASGQSHTDETFTSAKGNVFSCLSFAEQCDTDGDSNLAEVKLALYPKNVLADLQRVVRKEYLSHLEERHSSVLDNAMAIVKANKEELKSELDLRFHLHKSRYKRIKTDIHNIRAVEENWKVMHLQDDVSRLQNVQHSTNIKRILREQRNISELVHHGDCVDQHCRLILQALADVRMDFNTLQVKQDKLLKDLDTQVHNMEETFNTVTKSDKLEKLYSLLKSNLDEYMNIIQDSQRHFRQNMEDKFGGLREANVQLLKSFRLFSQGGNFSIEETEIHQAHLEQVAKHIDAADDALTLDMENMESSVSRCLEEATDLVSQLEEKFQFLYDDLVFLEKIKKVLRSTQVQIRSEVFKSNSHKQTINNMTSKLKKMIQVYVQTSLDKKVLTPDKLCTLTGALAETLKNRCHYLDCYVEPSLAVPSSDGPLRADSAVGTQPQSLTNEEGEFLDWDLLLQPTQASDELVNDVVVGLVKKLLRINKPCDSEVDISVDRKPQDNEVDGAVELSDSSKSSKTDSVESLPDAGAAQPGGRGQSAMKPQTGKERKLQADQKEATANVSPKPSKAASVRPAQKPATRQPRPKTTQGTSPSVKPVRSQMVSSYIITKQLGEKFQVFGSKPEDQQGIPTFKGVINNILWAANDILLHAAEDYYVKKESRPVCRPKSMHESFEQCAEDINKRLLEYLSQSQNYHSNSVKDFQKQLGAVEKWVCNMPEVILIKLRDQHVGSMNQSLAFIRQAFEQFWLQSERNKTEHIDSLSVRLSHPACEEELSKLINAEEDRQLEQTNGIERTKLELQDCIRKHADEFVTALATMTERLLFLFDHILTVNEVKDVQPPQEKNPRLGQKQTDPSLVYSPVLGPVSRVWPGIHYIGDTASAAQSQEQQETSAITTVKTSKGHLKAVEVRNALHKNYEKMVEEELERVKKFSQKHEAELLLWQNHWTRQLKILSTLKSE